MNNAITVSIIIPCRNEEKYIATVLENILAQDYPIEQTEVIVIDGISEDATKKEVSIFNHRFSHLYILENVQKTVPYALNMAIKQAKGSIIIRMDAHTEYSTDYVSKIIATFKTTQTDIAGGPMRAAGKTSLQKSIAYCTSTKMGVGNSAFHNENAKGWVDSVYLGAWKREIFDDVGLFDLQMLRNQDLDRSSFPCF